MPGACLGFTERLCSSYAQNRMKACCAFLTGPSLSPEAKQSQRELRKH